MREKLAKLIDVKSIMTLLMTGAFVYLAVTGALTPEQFLTIFTMAVSFYYGMKSKEETKK